MDNLLVDYFSQYIELNNDEIQLIKREKLVRQYDKGAVLLKAGAIADECFLVLKGCVKRYYLNKGEEKIMDFYLENDAINPVSYTTKEPSQYILECTEPCIISTGTEEKTQRFLQENPRFVPVFVKIGDILSAQKQVSSDHFKNHPPETRYQRLLKERPNLIDRVPQYMLASYLGIKPETLSRIRKRMWSN